MTKVCPSCRVRKPLAQYYPYKLYKCRKCILQQMAFWRNNGGRETRIASMTLDKLAALNHYGGARCACCGERQVEFLCLDHVNADGKVWRKVHGEGTVMIKWLKRNKYPKKPRLRANCNLGTSHGRICPHQRELRHES